TAGRRAAAGTAGTGAGAAPGRIAARAAAAAAAAAQPESLSVSKNPSPRPPPRSGEGEQDKCFSPLRFGEGAGGRGSPRRRGQVVPRIDIPTQRYVRRAAVVALALVGLLLPACAQDGQFTILGYTTQP